MSGSGCCGCGNVIINGSGIPGQSSGWLAPVSNEDGTVTHTHVSGDGTQYVITVCPTCADGAGTDSLVSVPNADGSITVTHTAVDGTVQTFVIPAPVAPSSFLAPVTNLDGTVTHTHVAGDGTQYEFIVCPTCAGDAGTDALAVVANADGSITVTHTAVDGTVETFTVPAPLPPSSFLAPVTNADGTVTHTHVAGDGTQYEFVVCPTCAGDAGTDALTVVTNADGSITITHTALDGTVETFDIPAPLPPSSFLAPVTNADGTVTHTHVAGDGTQYEFVVCPTCAGDAGTDSLAVVANADGSITVTHTAVDGTVEVFTVPPSSRWLDPVTNADGTVTHTHVAGDGTQYVITVCPTCAADAGSDSLDVVTNADGSVTVTHTAVDGTVQTFTIPAPAAGSVSELVINADGSFTHTDGDGGAPVIYGVQREDGTWLPVGPNGLPCASPDQSWCNPATGAIEPIPKGQTVLTAESCPPNEALPGGANGGFQAQSVSVTTWNPADQGDYVAFNSPAQTSTVECITITNPNLCWDIISQLRVEGQLKLEGWSQYDQFSVQAELDASFDGGASFFPLFIGNCVNIGQSTADTATPQEASCAEWSGSNDFPIGPLAPGESFTICTRASWRTTAPFADNVSAQITNEGFIPPIVTSRLIIEARTIEGHKPA